MSTASAAVKPTTTELDMKFTSDPNPSRPRPSVMTPDMSANVKARPMEVGGLGTASGTSTAHTQDPHR